MKKFFTFVVALVTFAGSANALENVPEPGLTFQGLFGMNLSDLRGSVIGANVKPGFNFGARAEYMLPKCAGVFVNLGANYTMKGAKNDVRVHDNPATLKARACYLEIPLHVGYRYNFSEDLGVFADFGPYFAMGINGNNVLDFESDSQDLEKHNFFRNDDNGDFGDIQRFDFGLGFRIGVEYANHHSLNAGFDFGVTDMYKHDFRKKYQNDEIGLYWKENYGLSNPTGLSLDPMKNFNFSLTYGYRF